MHITSHDNHAERPLAERAKRKIDFDAKDVDWSVDLVIPNKTSDT